MQLRGDFVKRFVDIMNYLFGSVFNMAIAAAIIIVAYAVTLWAFDYGREIGEGLGQPMADGVDFFAPVPETVLFEIPEDAGGLDIARELRSHGLINNEFVFYLQTRLNGSHSHFIRGASFELNTGMDQGTIMATLQSHQARLNTVGDELRVTFFEGATSGQIAEISATLGYFTSAEFMEEFENGEFLFPFLAGIDRPNRLEGFLFPDTYNLPQNPTPWDVIVRQLMRFEYVFTPQMQNRLENELQYELGLDISFVDLITIASIIELEARIPSQQPAYAAYIYNRLRAGMPLEAVSTLVYGFNRRADMLTPTDFAQDHPYNTFVRTGLPPSPVSNPGLSAIEAALNPSSANYLFATIADAETGRLYLTGSHEAYLAAVARYSVQGEVEEVDGD